MNKQTPKNPRSLALAATLALVAAPAAQAQLIAYEGFNLTAGANSLAASSGVGSSGFSTNWTTIGDANGGNVVSPGYTYSGITSVGNRAQIFNASASGDGSATYFYRTLTTPFSVAANSTGTFWASFMIASTQASTGGLAATIGFFGNNAPAANSPGITVGSVGSNSNFRVANRALDTSGSGSVLNTTTAAGTMAFIVLKVTIDTNTGGNELVSLWINPTTFNGTEASLGTASIAAASLGNTGLSTINSIAFGSNYVNTGSAVLNLDEIRLGTTLASVTAIPEPSAFAALAGLGVLGLAVTRRRRAR